MARDSKPPSKGGKDLEARDSSPVVAEPAANPMEVMDAPALVKGLISTEPKLAPLDKLLAMVAAAISFKRLDFPIEEALDQLETGGIDRPKITAGVDAMEKVAFQEAEVTARWFHEMTNVEINPKNLDSKPATAMELAEQAGYRDLGVKLDARVDALRAFLFPEAESDRNGVVKWLASARAKAEGIIYAPQESPVPTALPGWKTPPVLDDTKPAVKRILKQISMIETMKQKLHERTAVLKQLANTGFSAELVQGILDGADQLADAQVVQSDTVTKLALEHQAAFVAKARSYAAVLSVVQEAREYLNS